LLIATNGLNKSLLLEDRFRRKPVKGEGRICLDEVNKNRYKQLLFIFVLVAVLIH